MSGECIEEVIKQVTYDTPEERELQSKKPWFDDECRQVRSRLGRRLHAELERRLG